MKILNRPTAKDILTRMWANDQRDGRPAEHRWRPLFNAAVWLTPTTWLPCSNAAKTRNPLKTSWGAQTTGPISAASRPKFTILWGIWRRYCCITSFFPIVDRCLSCEDKARQSCTMVWRWRVFCVLHFSVSRVQHISDLHPKFALRPHHVWKYGRHPICDCWDYARKKNKEEEQITGWKK